MAKEENYYRKGLDVTAYGCVLLVSYFLVSGIYKEYLEARTDFAVTKEPVTIDDYPAVLVKFINVPGIKYGTDYTIEVRDWNEEAYMYIKDSNDVVVHIDQHNSSNRSQESGKNYIEVRTLSTTEPNNHLILISPMKKSLIFENEFLNGWKLFDLIFLDYSIAKNADNIFVGITSTAGFISQTLRILQNIL